MKTTPKQINVGHRCAGCGYCYNEVDEYEFTHRELRGTGHKHHRGRNYSVEVVTDSCDYCAPESGENDAPIDQPVQFNSATQMQQLIQITTDAQGASVVSARELYDFLEVKSKFSTWLPQRIKDFGFVEGTDYTTFTENSVKGRPTTEYALTLDMAKELSMVERNEKGKQARLYFIEAEKTLLSNPATIQAYFEKVRQLASNGEQYPVSLDEVWPLVYAEKGKAVRALKKEFFENEDYISFAQNGKRVIAQNGKNPIGGRPEVEYRLTVSCMEYFIARKVRAVFEVYRQVFHRVADRIEQPTPAVSSATEHLLVQLLASQQDQIKQQTQLLTDYNQRITALEQMQQAGQRATASQPVMPARAYRPYRWLTDSERMARTQRVMRLRGEGKSNRHIARLIGVSEGAVRKWLKKMTLD